MENIKPMLAETSQEPFDDPNFIFEWKWNGIRVLTHKEGGAIRLQGRKSMDYTAAFPEMANIGSFIKTDKAIIDGEIVCLNAKGLPEFNRVQNRFNQHDPATVKRLMGVYPAVYMVFDVVRVDEYDLTSHSAKPLTQIQRKEVLDKLVTSDSVIKKSIWVDGKGKDMHALAVQYDQEGIMAKTKSGLYVPGGRNTDWLKIKVPKFRNLVICGYTKGTGWRQDMFGAVVLGVPENGLFRYVGEAGSGFTSQGCKEMYDRLYEIESDDNPMLPGTKVEGLVSWVNPEIVIRVKYYDISKDGKLIWPIYQKEVNGDLAELIPGKVGFDYVPKEGE